jgi:nicotinamidase-related amidase
MLGGNGHAIVSAVEEAVFFHGVARRSQPNFQIKGNNPLTEHYSVFRPEVADDPNGRSIARENTKLLEQLIGCDALVIAGQAKSHCVAWTVDDLLEEIRAADPALARKIYLLEDCTSPVVIPGGPDFTEAAESAFSRFADAGMHRVRSTDPISEWPGIELKPVLGTDAG